MPLKLRSLRIEEIDPAPYNPRVELRPGDEDFDRLKRSIEEFGCVEPLVWNARTGRLVGGHQRLAVLRSQGAARVQVSVVDLDEAREKALNLALNRIAGRWDEEKLAALLDEILREETIDLDLTGFDLDEARELVERVLGPLEERDPDAFDAGALVPDGAPTVTKRGDLITLGREPGSASLLLCGDSTSDEDVKRLMGAGGDARAVLFATDPPYLVGYDGTNHPSSSAKRSPKAPPGTPHTPGTPHAPGKTPGNHRHNPRHSSNPTKKSASRTRSRSGGNNKDWSATYGTTWDDATDDPALYEGFIRCAVEHVLREDAAWYCWHASRRQAMLERVWIEAGAFAHCQIVWVKNKGVLTRTWYLWRHEPCLFGWKRGHMPPRRGGESLSTVWEVQTIPNGVERPDHPTPKPVALFERPMLQHTRPGEVCYEPFAGSGTQLIAAERLGRRCLALEISPRYCDLIVRRFIGQFGEGSVPREVAKKYRVPRTKGAVS